MRFSHEDVRKMKEQLDALAMKIDLYEKCEHAREKEFRELEREVYRLKRGAEEPMPAGRNAQAGAGRAAAMHDGGAVGQAWLR